MEDDLYISRECTGHVMESLLPGDLKCHLIKSPSGRLGGWSSTTSKATNNAKSATAQLKAKHYVASPLCWPCTHYCQQISFEPKSVLYSNAPFCSFHTLAPLPQYLQLMYLAASLTSPQAISPVPSPSLKDLWEGNL